MLLDASLSRLEVALTLGRSLSSIDYRRAHLRRLAA